MVDKINVPNWLDLPPTQDSSHHKDHYIFSRESRIKPLFVTVTALAIHHHPKLEIPPSLKGWRKLPLVDFPRVFLVGSLLGVPKLVWEFILYVWVWKIILPLNGDHAGFS